jgi:undecaprenyl-diphosphatase
MSKPARDETMAYSKTMLRRGTLALLALFAVLTFYVWLNPVNAFDVAFTKDVQARTWLEPLESTNALAKTPAFRLIYLILAIAFILAKRYMISVLVVASLASEIVTSAIKGLVGRPRPTPDVAVLLDHSPGYSYVSGHTLEYTLLFGMLALLALRADRSRLVRYIFAGTFFTLPLIIGMGRIYAGAHWLTDVIGSFLLAGATVLVVISASRKSPGSLKR